MGALRTSIDLPYQARETLLIRHGRFGGCAPNIPATPGGGGSDPQQKMDYPFLTLMMH